MSGSKPVDGKIVIALIRFDDKLLLACMACLGLSRFQFASEASVGRRSEVHRLAAVRKSASTRALDERLSERDMLKGVLSLGLFTAIFR